MTAKATTDRTADTKYTPDVPIQAMPMAIPATAGPSTRVVLMLICPRTTAFGSRSRPTSWPVIAMRAGPRKANATACTADDTSSIQYSTKSNATPNPIHADVTRHRQLADGDHESLGEAVGDHPAERRGDQHRHAERHVHAARARCSCRSARWPASRGR